MQVRPGTFISLLTLGLVAVVLVSVGVGAMHLGPGRVLHILLAAIGLADMDGISPAELAVVTQVRLPRVVAGVLIGASLAVSGAVMQGLFRNPLADPGLIGISAGASLAAALVIIVLSGGMLASSTLFSRYGLSVAAFLGAAVSGVAVYQISRSGGRTMVATMLLAGIAINAIAMSITGFLTFHAGEAQLRDITFWMLGSLGGATWGSVLGMLPFVLLPMLLLPSLPRPLNAFALGETDAAYLGVNIKSMKWRVVLVTTMTVGASVAVAGAIGFIGLVIPHVIRLAIGPDHRTLIPASMLLGATVLVLSDLLCRTVLAPAELPIGVVTALIGTPMFISLIIKEKRTNTLFA